MCGKYLDNHTCNKTVSSVIKGTHWKHVPRTPLIGGL